jgi:hypothetical protein
LKRLLIAVLVTACATSSNTSKPAPVPQWDAVPPGAVEAFCQRLQMDTVASGAPLTIVRTTQPIATQQALVALGGMTGGRATSGVAEEALQAGQRSIPISVPQTSASGCVWNPADRLDPRIHSDRMVVELSAPLPNPFVRNAAGFFARVSLGGQNAAWYWVGLVPRGGGWGVGPIIPLGV